MQTVTILLETYEKMKTEIKFLREQNKAKTIVRNIYPPIYGFVALVISIIVAIWHIKS